MKSPKVLEETLGLLGLRGWGKLVLRLLLISLFFSDYVSAWWADSGPLIAATGLLGSA
jgi:hypothetical protein